MERLLILMELKNIKTGNTAKPGSEISIFFPGLSIISFLLRVFYIPESKTTGVFSNSGFSLLDTFLLGYIKIMW